MTDSRKGGLALMAGNIALLVTMALHPTGEQLATAGSRFGALALLNAFVHTLALFSIPILFLGAIALTREIADEKRIAFCGAVFYTFALCAGMGAAAMSGYVAPDVLRRMARANDPQMWRALFAYTGLLNQAFARILVVGAAVAIILWSSALKTAGLRWYGIVSNALIIVAVITALLPLNVHGYGLVVLLQAAWFFTVGAKMWLGQLTLAR